jgi:hypothetical protein
MRALVIKLAPAIQILFGVILLIPVSKVHAYEETTHSILTAVAVQQADIYKDATLLKKLGFPSREQESYRIVRQGGLQAGTPLALDAHIAAGAMYEDSQFLRVVCHHFFDPQANGGQGIGLTPLASPLVNGCVNLTGGAGGIESPLWILEDRQAVEFSGAPTRYSMRRGYGALKQSLAAPNKSDRSYAQSLALQMLGHMVHHVQDMAQPQHTRNEIHVHGSDIPQLLVEEAAAAYEVSTQKVEASIPDLVLNINSRYGPVDPSRFPTARHYWHTPGTLGRFVGMAEFAGQNFLTYKSSLGAFGVDAVTGVPTVFLRNPNFPLPSGTNPDGTSMRFEEGSVATEPLVNGQSVTGRRYYLKGQVSDGYSGVVKEEILGTKSLFPWATEDERVFDTRRKILLPRTVAFSVSLIDYFFRGRISLAQSTSGSWLLRNSGRYALVGKVTLYTEDKDGTRSPLAGAASIPVSLIPNAEQPVNFILPDNYPRKVIALFEGRMGSEGGVDVNGSSFALNDHVTGDVVDLAAPPTVVVSPSTLAVPTSGQAVTVAVSLSSRPVATETITVARQSGAPALSASPVQLVFTTSNWQTAQSVAISGSPNPFAAQTATFLVGSARLDYKQINVSQAPLVIACGGPYFEGPTQRNFGNRIEFRTAPNSSFSQTTLELGSTSGTVTFSAFLPYEKSYAVNSTQYQAFLASPFRPGSPPALPLDFVRETVTVTSGSNQVASTLLNRPGENSFTFYHDPSATGSTKVTIKEAYPVYAYVTLAAADSPIVRQASCPSGTLDPLGGTNRITFGIDIPVGKLSCGQWIYLVNGFTNNTLVVSGAVIYIEMLYDPSKFPSCSGTSGRVPGTPWYRFATGGSAKTTYIAPGNIGVP